MKSKRGIIFTLDGYSNYTFLLSEGSISGKKCSVDRASDSGVITCYEEVRFNLISDQKERRTVRLLSLIDYLPKAFK